MRVTTSIVMAIVIATALPESNALAQSGGPSGDYVGLRFTGGVSRMKNISKNTGGVLEIRNDKDEVAGLGATLGYDWAKKGIPVRTEVDYTYRARFDFDTRITGGANAGFENNVSTHQAMLNALYDFDFGGNWRPYLGGGVGLARNHSEVTRVPLGTGGQFNQSFDEDCFVWSGNVGVTIALSSRWLAELGYRYMSLGNVRQGRFSDATGTIIEADKYTSHDLILALHYRF